jgi:hypothetical protein
LSRIHKAHASEGSDKENGSSGQELTGSATNGKNETVLSEDSEKPSRAFRIEKKSIIREYHASLIGGQMGISRTYEGLIPFVRGPNMRRDIGKCASCQRNKHTVTYMNIALEVTDTPYAPLGRLVWTAWDPCL